jgi:hypothetical protein
MVPTGVLLELCVNLIWRIDGVPVLGFKCLSVWECSGLKEMVSHTKTMHHAAKAVRTLSVFKLPISSHHA